MQIFLWWREWTFSFFGNVFSFELFGINKQDFVNALVAFIKDLFLNFGLVYSFLFQEFKCTMNFFSVSELHQCLLKYEGTDDQL